MGSYPFSFRTRKSSPLAPMVLRKGESRLPPEPSAFLFGPLFAILYGMSWALRRQLLILFIILLFLVGFGALFFWITRPTLSCFDKKMNQDEIGIDCGGSCDRFCADSMRNPVVRWSRVLAVRSGWVDAVAFIENPNPSGGLREMEYVFRLYDAKNSPVAEKRGRTFLNPGEKFALYEPNIAVGTTIPVRAYLEISEPQDGFLWRKPSIQIGKPNLEGVLPG